MKTQDLVSFQAEREMPVEQKPRNLQSESLQEREFGRSFLSNFYDTPESLLDFQDWMGSPKKLIVKVGLSGITMCGVKYLSFYGSPKECMDDSTHAKNDDF